MVSSFALLVRDDLFCRDPGMQRSQNDLAQELRVLNLGPGAVEEVLVDLPKDIGYGVNHHNIIWARARLESSNSGMLECTRLEDSFKQARRNRAQNKQTGLNNRARLEPFEHARVSRARQRMRCASALIKPYRN